MEDFAVDHFVDACSSQDIMEFERPGVLLLNRNSDDDQEQMAIGTLSLFRSGSDRGFAVCLKWIPEDEKNSSFRPLDIELMELKSFRLSDDGNRLTLIQRDGTKHPPLVFLDQGPEDLLAAMKKHFCVRQSQSDENLYLLKDKDLNALDESLSRLNLFDASNTDAVWKFVNDIQRDPYTTALSAFSKIADKLIFSSSSGGRPYDEDMMAVLFHNNKALDITTGHRDEGSFEVVTPRPKLTDKLPKVKRSCEPVCQLDWELHWDEQGRVLDLEQLRDKMFRGGLEHSVRSEAWKFLLDYYDFGSSQVERAETRKQKVDDYFRMKLQWRSITIEQEDRFAAFRERKSQIEKDVSRTDRAHMFFQGDDNKNVQLLQDILMTYVMYNFDLGYVQGMSDLLAPLLYVMQNEVDAFWCFVGFMSRVGRNFDFDQGGMKKQLDQLIELLKTCDPEFYSYLDAKDSGNLFFCFRWLLIWFKREFPFSDVMRLWEVLWVGKPCPNFHLLVCIALLDQEKRTIMENGFGFNEILKHINDMANSRVDIPSVLSRAEAIYIRLCQSQYVSNASRRIIGLPPLTEADLAAAAKPVSSTTNGEVRRKKQDSGTSAESLNNSSSVEVLSELDDEAKFENALNHFE